MEIINKRISILGSKPFHRSLKTDELSILSQFISFGIIGISNTILSYLIYVLFLKLLENYCFSLDFIVANTVAFLISVFWSYYWNNRLVFKSSDQNNTFCWKTLLKPYISYGLTGVLIANVLSKLWIDIFGISKYIAPLINLFISVPLNFLINKFWAFKK